MFYKEIFLNISLYLYKHNSMENSNNNLLKDPVFIIVNLLGIATLIFVYFFHFDKSLLKAIIILLILIDVFLAKMLVSPTPTQKEFDKAIKLGMGKCPHCYKEISRLATKCPHCTSSI